MRLRGIGVSGNGYNEVLVLEVLNVVDCVERGRSVELLSSSWASRAVAAALSFQACLCACICTRCMYVCMYVYICMCTDMYICMYMNVYVCMYTCACIYMCICVYMHICV